MAPIATLAPANSLLELVLNPLVPNTLNSASPEVNLVIPPSWLGFVGFVRSMACVIRSDEEGRMEETVDRALEAKPVVAR